MKLRIKGSSVRLRLQEDEVKRLARTGRVEQQARMTREATLVYGLESADIATPSLRYRPNEITVLLPAADVDRWATTDLVGLDGSVDLGDDRLRILVEKDFPCEHP